MEAVQPGHLQDPVAAPAGNVDVMLEDDPVLGQGAGLVGAEHVHGAEVLDRVEALDHHLAPRHRHRALGQVGADDHRQHFRGQADRHGESEHERLGPVALGETVDQQHDRHHHQHEADQQPTDAVHPTVEGGLRPRTDDGTGQRTEIGARTGGNHHRGGRAADHVGADEADVRQFEQVLLVGGDPLGGLLADRAEGVVFLHRQRLAGEYGLADEQVARFDQADVGGDHVAGGQAHDVADHQFAHGDFPQLAAHPALVAAQHGGGVPHHGLERLGGLARTVFLPEAHQAADQDHAEDDDDAGEIGFLTVLQGQPEVGEEADRRERHQHVDEGVVERLQQLHQDVWRTVVGHFVGAVGVQPGGGLGLVEAILATADVGEGGFQAVLRFAGGAHGQSVVAALGIELGIALGRYAHDSVSCRELRDGDTSRLPVR